MNINQFFKYQSLTTVEQILLANLSLLPCTALNVTEIFSNLGISKTENLRYFNALHSLQMKGYLEKKSDKYIFPLSKKLDYVAVNYIDIDDCKKIVNEISKKFASFDDTTDLKDFTEIAENIVNFIETPTRQIAVLANNLSVYFDIDKNMNDSLKYSHRAIELQIIIDNQSDELCFYYNNLALVYRKMGRYPKALRASLKSKRLAENTNTKNSKLLAHTYNILSATYGRLHHYSKAVEFNLKAIEHGEKASGIAEITLANYYYDAAVTYYNSTNFLNAKHYIDHAITLYKNARKDEIGHYKEIMRNQKIFTAFYKMELLMDSNFQVAFYSALSTISLGLSLYLVFG